ncbi:uncharacterized protein JCM6883_007455 [Sporobolomyces salmoneus]|uniref:uncharacterized protein n=1 Tax=Sporobolomyces salmoneus TaxID=183962 RepID=UPI00316F7413
MQPLPEDSSRRRRSLTRSTTSPNLRRVDSPIVTPRSSSHTKLPRARTSLDVTLQPGGNEKREENHDTEEEEEREEEESNPLEGLVSDLEEIIGERRERRTGEQSDEEEWGRPDAETTGGEGTNTVLDEIENLGLPSRLGDDDNLTSSTSSSTRLGYDRARGRPVTGDWENEGQSSAWNPENYTSKIISQGAGGGGGRPALSQKGKVRVVYDVPEEAERWTASQGTIEEVESRTDWNFDRLVSSRSDARGQEEEAEKRLNRACGRTRANERLKMVENQFTWS